MAYPFDRRLDLVNFLLADVRGGLGPYVGVFLIGTGLWKGGDQGLIDGVVINRAIDPGQTVAASFQTPTLFVIAQDLRKMRVLADIDEIEDSLANVVKGPRGKLRVDMPGSLGRLAVAIGEVGGNIAGIGGFDLGFEKAGWTCSWQVELDLFCRHILERHWPKVLRHGDVRTWPTPGAPEVDAIVGGFPCQPVSQADGRVERTRTAAPAPGLPKPLSGTATGRPTSS